MKKMKKNHHLMIVFHSNVLLMVHHVASKRTGKRRWLPIEVLSLLFLSDEEFSMLFLRKLPPSIHAHKNKKMHLAVYQQPTKVQEKGGRKRISSIYRTTFDYTRTYGLVKDFWSFFLLSPTRNPSCITNFTINPIDRLVVPHSTPFWTLNIVAAADAAGAN